MRTNIHRTRSFVLFAPGLILASSAMAAAAFAASDSSAPDTCANPGQKYGCLPMSFEANQGQTEGPVRFLSRGNGYSVRLTDGAAVLALHRPADGTVGTRSLTRRYKTEEIRMELLGGKRDAQAVGLEQLPGYANYFLGQDPAQWRRNVPTFARVRYSSIYPGVDLVYYGNQGQLEYDFIVAPGADPKAIGLQFAGARQIRLRSNGDLRVAATSGEVAFHKPIIYQQVNGHRRRIAGGFVLRRDHRVGFAPGRYDRSKALIIDPVLEYSTYFGGTQDFGSAIAVDRDGNAYVVGDTDSSPLPVTKGAFDTHFDSPDGLYVTFVSKFNPSGTALLYSTYLGTGACYSQDILDNGLGPLPQNALAVDHDDNVYVAGSVCSGSFPVTKGAFQTSIRGGGAPAYVAKLNSSGSELLYATYLGGSGGDVATALAVDTSGNAFVGGYTGSTDFPVTSAAFQTHNRAAENNSGYNAFVTKLNPTGSRLVYSTYLGGRGNSGGAGDSANALALDRDGNAYVAGVTFSNDFPVTSGAFQTANRGHTSVAFRGNAFVTKLNATGSALEYSSYLGGSPPDGSAGTDAAYALAVDAAGHAYVAGSAVSADFPVTKGAYQTRNKAAGKGQYPGNNGFITKLDPTGSALLYSTFLGGSGFGPDSDGVGGDAVNSIAVDDAGHAFVAGVTSSADFPVTRRAFQTTNRSLVLEERFGISAFVAELDGTGEALVASTYLGGTGEDYAKGLSVDSSGSVYVTGFANSADFPISEKAFRQSRHGYYNAFIAKLDLNAPTSASVTHLSASANPQIGGQPVTFTATVASAATSTTGEAAPAGFVEFTFSSLPSNPFAVKVPLDAAGKATYTTKNLAVGSYSVVASYSVLAPEFGPSSSPVLTETIQNPPESHE
jgi:hypothetical protein